MYPCSCFLMYYLSCFVAPLLLLLNNSWAAPHFCLCVCIWVCLLIGALPLLIAAQPRLLTDPLSCDRSSKGRWWWWEGMLSLTSAHLYPFQVQPEPTDSTSPLISVQLPLCLQHTDMHAHIYKYLYSAQMSCQHGPVGCAAPPTVYSRSFNRSVVQHLTFSLFFFFFFRFNDTPRGTNSHSGFSLYFTTQTNTNSRGEFMTLQCADWTQRRLSGDKDCWKLRLQWKPFWPDWVRPTDFCGWWLGGKQVSQQYSPVDTISSQPRWGMRWVSDFGR